MELGTRLGEESPNLRDYEFDLEVLKAALVATANAVVITDVAGAIQWVNPAFTQLTGYDREEVVGKNASVLKSGYHGAEYYRHLWNTLLLGEVWSGEFINHKKDGSLFVDLQTITPLRGSDGAITHFIAVKQDITHLKQVEQRMEESETTFRSIFEHSMDAILLTMSTGAILRANPAACVMFGRTEAELQGLGSSSILDLSDPAFAAALEERARTGWFKGNIRFMRSDGSKFTGHVTSNMFQTKTGLHTSIIIREAESR